MAGDIYESDGEETPVARWIVRFSRMVISSVATDTFFLLSCRVASRFSDKIRSSAHPNLLLSLRIPYRCNFQERLRTKISFTFAINIYIYFELVDFIFSQKRILKEQIFCIDATHSITPMDNLNRNETVRVTSQFSFQTH